MQPYTNPNYFMQNQYNPLAPYQQRLANMEQQYAPQPQMMQNSQPVQPNNALLWVQGESGAKSYLIAPNTTLLLMDSESEKFYIKSSDSSGMPNLRTFEYTEITGTSQAQKQPEINLDDKYVTRDEYQGLKSQYEQLMKKLEEYKPKETAIKEPEEKPVTKGGNR